MFPADYTVELTSSHPEWKNDDFYKFEVADVPDYVGADCWGIAVQKANGTLIPKMDTYSLYVSGDAMWDPKFKSQSDYRDAVCADPDCLLSEAAIGDSIVIYMFGEDGYKVVITKKYGWKAKYTIGPGCDVSLQIKKEVCWNTKFYMSPGYFKLGKKNDKQ